MTPGISWITLLVLALAAGEGVNSYEFRRVCYYTNWAQYRPAPAKYYPENIPLHLCTHLIYAFATMDGNKLKAYEWNDDSTSWMDGMFKRFNNLKQKNTQLKTLLGVGGWNFGTKKMTAMLKTKKNRKEFIDTSIKFLRSRDFDGLDLDFEYPAARGSPDGDKYRFSSLVGELYNSFEREAKLTGKPRLLLSAAVAAGKDNIDKGYDIPFVSKRFDFINVMTYDFHGKWEEETGHNCPLYAHRKDKDNHKFLNLAYAAEYWHKKGAPKHKLNIGLPLYGRTFTLSDTSKTDVKAPVKDGGKPGKYTREGGYMSYYEVCDFILEGASTYWITDCYVPYAVKGDQWVGFDDEESLRVKVEFIRKNGFGGVMVWAIDLDDFGNTCGRGEYPLMSAINDALGDGYHTAVAKQLGITAKQGPANGTGIALSPQEDVTITLNMQQASNALRTGEDCTTRPDGFYPDATACSSYYRCTGGQPLHLTCPVGSTFHPKQKTCTFLQHNLCPGVGKKSAPPPAPKPTMSESERARREFLAEFGGGGGGGDAQNSVSRPRPQERGLIAKQAPAPAPVSTAVQPYKPQERYSAANPSYLNQAPQQQQAPQPVQQQRAQVQQQYEPAVQQQAPQPVQQQRAQVQQQYEPAVQQHPPHHHNVLQQRPVVQQHPPLVPAPAAAPAPVYIQPAPAPAPVYSPVPAPQQFQHQPYSNMFPQHYPPQNYNPYVNQNPYVNHQPHVYNPAWQLQVQQPQNYYQPQFTDYYSNEIPQYVDYAEYDTGEQIDSSARPTIKTPDRSVDALASAAKNSFDSQDIVTDDERPVMTEDDQFFIDYLIYNLGALPAK